MLSLSLLNMEAGTQTRNIVNEGTVKEYANVMSDEAVFPPIIVYKEGEIYYLADGFHRVRAAQQIGLKELDADVRQGTRKDALKFALGANDKHGLRRTAIDKRKCVDIALAEFGELSDRQIADICVVSKTLVLEVRSARSVDAVVVEYVIGRDGKKYPTKRRVSNANNITVKDTPETKTIENQNIEGMKREWDKMLKKHMEFEYYFQLSDEGQVKLFFEWVLKRVRKSTKAHKRSVARAWRPGTVVRP